MKKFVSFILAAAIMMSLSVVPMTARAAVTREDGMISLLKELGIMQGDENGDMGLDRLVSRAEFAKIAIAASPAKNTVAIGLKMSPYKDVPYTEWYAPYVRAAVSAGYVNGYLDATYRPNNTVTYEEAVTVLLRLLGYSDGSFGAAYPYGQIAQAQGLDMLDDVGAEIGDQMTRRQIMQLVYNTLRVNINISTSTTTSTSSGSGSYSQNSDSQSSVSQNSHSSQSSSQSSSQNSSTSTTVGTSKVSNSLLGFHDCVMADDIDIIAGYAQDNSLGSDKVFTSAGKYTKGMYFDDSWIGMKGTVFIKNSRDIIAFMPDEGSAQEDYEAYFVYSKLLNSVVGYNNGNFETINIPDSTTVYRNQMATNYMSIKSGLEMGDTLYVKRTNGGSIDYITYESGTMEGPVKVTSSGWLASVGGSSSSTVMRDGVRSSAGAIMTNDIIYYSAPLDMVFAYSNKVTGIYESASPTKDSPTSVTISGVTYVVEGVDAFNNLSSSGKFNYGDTVTICIGKDGGAAGVVTSATQSAGTSGSSGATNTSANVVGYVTDAGTKLFTDSNNREYSSYYITLVAPDGTVGTYETDYNRTSFVGSVCSLTLKDGKAVIGKVSAASVSGRVEYNNLTLGDYKLSPNVSILDVANDNVFKKVLYKRVYTQRIDGMTLNQSQILYCERNAMNEITAMILNNVTGDVYTYGVVTSSNQGLYTVDVNGSSYQASLGGSYGGPVKLVMDAKGIGGMMTLSRYNSAVTELTATTAKIGGVTYRLSPDVVCYGKTISTPYRKISIDDAMSGDYTIDAYYDKIEANGGRIRILVCNEH